MRSDVVNYLIFNDVHFPQEDRIRYKIALKIAKEIPNLAHIYLNGDIGEFAGFSTWPKHPGESHQSIVEIEYMNKKFDELCDLFPDIPVTLIEGNHCHRFFRYIRDIAPQMWGLVNLPSLLKFPERPKWDYVIYNPDQIKKCGAANLWLRHEPLAGGANHAAATAVKSSVDLAYGHTHVWQYGSHKKFGPADMFTRAYSLGWLGDKNKSCFDYRGSKDNWCEGFTRVECHVPTGNYNLEFIDLRKIPVFYRGELYDAL